MYLKYQICFTVYVYLLQAHEGDNLKKGPEACPEAGHSPRPHGGRSTGRAEEHMSPVVDQGYIGGTA